MDMDMGGMDMSSASMFTPANMKINHIYWYTIVAVVGSLAARRLIDQARIFIEYVSPWSYDLALFMLYRLTSET
jgi:hypothetical protein